MDRLDGWWRPWPTFHHPPILIYTYTKSQSLYFIIISCAPIKIEISSFIFVTWPILCRLPWALFDLKRKVQYDTYVTLPLGLSMSVVYVSLFCSVKLGSSKKIMVSLRRCSGVTVKGEGQGEGGCTTRWSNGWMSVGTVATSAPLCSLAPRHSQLFPFCRVTLNTILDWYMYIDSSYILWRDNPNMFFLKIIMKYTFSIFIRILLREADDPAVVESSSGGLSTEMMMMIL